LSVDATVSSIFCQHHSNPACVTGLSSAVWALVQELNRGLKRDVVYLCIGTDRATGDCLGPLVGNRLRTLLPSAHIFGCLEEPLHAVNLEATMHHINQTYADPLIIAVDAGLGASEKVGFLSIKRGSLAPGLALKKQLPRVGDFHIVGTVNVSGFCEHLVLQNTRLFVVYKMAEAVARALFLAHHRYISSISGSTFKVFPQKESQSSPG